MKPAGPPAVAVVAGDSYGFVNIHRTPEAGSGTAAYLNEQPRVPQTYLPEKLAHPEKFLPQAGPSGGGGGEALRGARAAG